MRVLVTGLQGFTGRYLQQELEAHGHEVVGLDCDLLDAPALAAAVRAAAPQAVAHLAAIAFVGHGDADAFYRVNLLGTRHLLAALAEYAPEVGSILLASSANVYGNAASELLDETTPAAPANDYAVSKLAMEHMARLWQERLPLFIVRPFNYSGVGQPENFLVPKIVAHFRRRAPAIELGNIDVWRDFGDVRDVAAAYRRLLEQPPLGATVNICRGETHSLRELLGMCEQLSGHRLEVRVNPALVRANEVRRLRGDAGRLHRLLGEAWAPRPLADTLAWMLDAPEQGGQA